MRTLRWTLAAVLVLGVACGDDDDEGGGDTGPPVTDEPIAETPPPTDAPVETEVAEAPPVTADVSVDTDASPAAEPDLAFVSEEEYMAALEQVVVLFPGHEIPDYMAPPRPEGYCDSSMETSDFFETFSFALGDAPEELLSQATLDYLGSAVWTTDLAPSQISPAWQTYVVEQAPFFVRLDEVGYDTAELLAEDFAFTESETLNAAAQVLFDYDETNCGDD